MNSTAPRTWGWPLRGRKFCHPDGPMPCSTMIIGEGPGKQEDARGQSFIGPAGDTLDTYLWRVGLPRGSVYVTNLVKHRCAEPGDPDRPPSAEEIEEGAEFLRWEFEQVQPRFIITLGGSATRAIIPAGLHGGRDMDILNGRPIKATSGEWYIPVIHPAAGLRDPDMAGLCFQGLKRAEAFIRRGAPDLWPGGSIGKSGHYAKVMPETSLENLLEGVEHVFVDTEGLHHDPWCLSFSVDSGIGWVIDGVGLVEECILERFNGLIQDKIIVLHNALHDLRVLAALGVHPRRYLDTMVLAYLTQGEPQGLKGLAWRICGLEMSDYSDVVAPFAKLAAERYLKGAADTLAAGGLVVDLASKRAHSPEKRIRTMLKKLEGKGNDEVRTWWRGFDFSTWIESSIGPMPGVSREDIPDEVLVPYAACDADATGRVFPYLMKRKAELKLDEVFEMDMAVIPMLDSMQQNGMPLDLQALSELDQDLEVSKRRLDRELCKMVGKDFNPGSGDQVAEFLFVTLGAGSRRMTKSRARLSTDDKALQTIVVTLLKDRGLKIIDPVEENLSKLSGRDADIYRFITLEQDYREADKTKGTFVEPLFGFYNAATGCVHPHIRSTRVVSGRLSTHDPNLLAVPIRTALGKRVRNCYRLPEGSEETLATWDLDQIEMRGMANESGDDTLIEAFLSGVDVHAKAASVVFGKSIDECLIEPGKSLYRTPAKNLQFGIAYGLTEKGLQEQLFLNGLDYSLEGAAKLISDWFEAYSGVRTYLQNATIETRKHGFVRDRWGRIRWLPGVWSNLDWIRAEAERQAGNMKIQGWAQGVIKRAMIRIWNRVVPELWAMGIEIRFLLQVHDELIARFPAWAKPIVDEMIVDEMRRDSDLFIVPITSKGSFAMSWGSLK